MADLPETAEWVEGIYQLEKSDPVSGGAEINPATKQGISNLPLLQLAKRTAFLKERIDNMAQVDPIAVTVGSTGDFAGIVQACEELTRYRAAFVNNVFAVSITLQAGFEMAEQLIVRGVDLSWIDIIATDPVVPLIRSALSIDLGGGSYPAFAALDGGGMPRLSALFQMDTSGSASGRHGYYMRRTGITGIVNNGGGIKDAAGNAIDLGGGAVFRGNSCDFSGAGGDGIVLDSGSRGICLTNDFSGAAARGVRARGNSFASIRNSNCRKGVSDSPDDIRCEDGSIISAGETIGGTNLTPNTLTSSGIIFK